MKTCKDCKNFKTSFKVGKLDRNCSDYGIQEGSPICPDFKSLYSDENEEVNDVQEVILKNGIFDSVHDIFKIQKATDKALEEFNQALLDLDLDLPMNTEVFKSVNNKMSELFLTHQYALNYGFQGEFLNEIMGASISRLFGPESTVNFKPLTSNKPPIKKPISPLE